MRPSHISPFALWSPVLAHPQCPSTQAPVPQAIGSRGGLVLVLAPPPRVKLGQFEGAAQLLEGVVSQSLKVLLSVVLLLRNGGIF